MLLTVGGVGLSDNLGISVDRHRYALRAAERPKVGYADPVVVESVPRDDTDHFITLIEAVADVLGAPISETGPMPLIVRPL